jgi:hypothetical protein
MSSASVAEYDEAERAARPFVSNTQIMSCEPVTFNRVGYPTRVTTERELAHYVDLLSLNGLANVPFDAGVFFRGASLYASYSPDEADLVVSVCDRVAALTRARFGKAVRPIINPLTQIGMFRAVQAIAGLLGKRQLRIFEIGPGFGYLGVFLGLQGHQYLSFEVTQALYLWQARLFEEFFGDEFCDAAQSEEFSPQISKRFTHLPWWHFVRLFQASVPPVDVVIANGVLGEMSRICLLYCTRLFKDMFSGVEDPLIVFNNFGNPLESSPEFVVAEFKSKGFEEILSSKFHAFSPTPARTKKKLAVLEKEVPQFRPSNRSGELKASEFMRATWDEAPDSLAFNCYVTGYTPPVFAGK